MDSTTSDAISDVIDPPVATIAITDPAVISTPLTVPTIALAGATATQIQLSGSAASGGNGVYNYQWHRGLTAGFTPSSSNAVPLATTLNFNDISLVPGVPYFYILEATDGSSMVYSNQVIAGLAVPTAPLSFSQQGGPVAIGYLGSSTWAINQGSGLVPTLIEQQLRAAYPNLSLTTVNGAIGGTGTGNFLPGQPYNNALKTAIQGTTGYKVLRMMIGSNDAAAGMPTATWQANMQTIINDALAWPVDKIVLEEIGLRLDAGNGGVELIRQYNAARSNLLGPKVVLGTSFTFENQADHLNTLSADKVHQTNAGQLLLAGDQATEVSWLFADRTPPAISAAATDSDGLQIVATLSEAAIATVPGTSGFWLTGTSAGVVSWSVTGNMLTLQLSGRVAAGETITLNGQAGVLQDAAGNPMGAVTALAVTNNSFLGQLLVFRL